MDINLNSNFNGNIGVRPDMQGIGGVGGAAEESPKASRIAANLTVGKGVDALSSAEPTAEITADALSRDDDLGKLVNAAFSLPAPPMPAFPE